MPNAVEFVTFFLKKDVSVQDFLLVSDKFNREYLSGQKGYISRRLLADGEMWADYVLWETMEDARAAMRAWRENEAARAYVSLLKPNGKGCRLLHLPVERSYGEP